MFEARVYIIGVHGFRVEGGSAFGRVGFRNLGGSGLRSL